MKPQLDLNSPFFESTLNREAIRNLRKIGSADIVIGIPAHRNGQTIGEVVDAVVEGVARYYADKRVLVICADGGSSDHTVKRFEDAQFAENTVTLATIYEGTRGKGTAIKTIFEAAVRVGAQACMVVEARAPGITADWLPKLIEPVTNAQCDVALGSYQRSAFARALTDNLVYPVMRVLMHTDLAEPLSSEFCISGALAGDLVCRDVWETEVARFGINVWLATAVVLNEQRVVQVDLGYRGEGGGEPGALFDSRFSHTVGTLFRSLAQCPGAWSEEEGAIRVPFVGPRCSDCSVPCEDCRSVLLDAFHEGREQCLPLWQAILTPSTMEAVEALYEQSGADFVFDADLWARIVTEFAIVYSKGDGDPDRVADALLPLFYARTITYLQQTTGLTCAGRQPIVEEIVEAFAQLRSFFVQNWNAHDTWFSSSEFWF